jgi:1-acyl-sn-glycerol-3-phosphate acyltransferase
VKEKNGTVKVQSEVFKAKEQRLVVFPDGTVSARIFLAYKDDNEQWRQQNIEDFKHGGGKGKLEGEDSLN